MTGKTVKPKKRRTRRPNINNAKKYVGRDNIKDKSIKININNGSGGGGSGKSTAPPSVNVYPQQHLIQDRKDKTALIDDKVGQSNLLQLLSDKHNEAQTKIRELMDKKYLEQEAINNANKGDLQLLSKGQNELLGIAQSLYKPQMRLKETPEQPDIPLFQPSKPVLIGNNGILMTPLKTKKLIEGEYVEVPIEKEPEIKQEDVLIEEVTPKEAPQAKQPINNKIQKGLLTRKINKLELQYKYSKNGGERANLAEEILLLKQKRKDLDN